METDNGVDFVISMLSRPRFDRETHMYFEWCYRKIKQLNTEWEMNMDLTELEKAHDKMKEEYKRFYS
jgi:hypothetical protein